MVTIDISLQVRNLNHENINPFVGACVEAPNTCILMLYAQKGSLQVWEHCYVLTPGAPFTNMDQL